MQQEITFVNYCVQEHNDPSILNRHWNSRRTPLSSMAQLLQYRCTMDAARLQNRRKHIIKLNVMLQMGRKTRIEERKKSDLYLPTIVKVHFKSFNCKIGQQKPSNFETGRIGSYGSFEGDFIF